uniref:Unannotated protein n=1 Tax=freshwater metagenome TaxID=449393 RepID=A0A6J5Z7Y9_9ZZZZ
MLEQPTEELKSRLRERRRAVRIGEDVVAIVIDESEVVVMAVCRHAGERLRHERRQQVVLAADRGADLTVGRDVVGGLDRTVKAEVQLQLAGGILMVAVAHVEAHLLAVFDNVEQHRTQFFELMDVVAVGLRDADRRLARKRLAQPHHLRLDSDQEVEAKLLFEALNYLLEVLAWVGVEPFAAFGVVTVAEDSRHARLPRQHLEGVKVGDCRQL